VTRSRVLVVRHGQSEGNVARVWTSSRVGYPLTDLGREQARSVGRSLAGTDVAAVYGSPLPRARETAELIAAALGLQAAVLDGVEELHVGRHEGQHDDEVGPVAAEVFGRWWRDGDLSDGFPGGETGEQIAARVRHALDQVADRHAGGTAVVVSHGGAMAVGITSLADNLDPAFVSQHILANTEIVDLERSGAAWRCRTWAGISLD
jgi:probable phosphoglycerate mutase